MSDTPETDAAKWVEVGYNSFVVSASIASKLERERDEARDLADRYRVAFCSSKGDLVPQVFPWEEAK